MAHDGQTLTADRRCWPTFWTLTAAALPEVEALFGRRARRRCGPGSRSAARSRRGAGGAPVRGPCAVLAGDLCRGAAPDARLGRAAGRGRGHVRRDGGAAPADRLWRIPRPDPRRHPDEPGRDRAACRTSGHRRCTRPAPPPRTLIAQGNTPAARARLVALMRDNHGRATFGATGLDDELEMIRDQFRRFADEQVVPHRPWLAPADELIPMEIIEELAELGVFGLTIPEEFGGFGLSKASMVRGVRGTVARLYRRRLARHALRDRRRTDPVRRHARAEGAVAAEARQRRDPADGGLHRTEHRLRPRQPAHPRGAGGRRLGGDRQQDLDHPCRAHPCDDAAGAHRPGHHRLPRPVDVPGRKDARHRRRPLPDPRHDRRRDRGAGLSRHEGIRAGLRRLRGQGREPARRGARGRASSS